MTVLPRSLPPFIAQTVLSILGRTQLSPDSWLPLAAQKSLLWKQRHCWIFSDLIWMKSLIRSCCSSWQNTHRQQSPIFTRSASGINLLFSKWRQHQMAEQKGGKKKSFTSCENCPFNFHEKIWDKNKRNVLLAVSFLIGVVDREHFLSPFNS